MKNINRHTGTQANRLPKKGQSTLELTAALIVLMILLVGAARIFVWLNERMAWRQSEYENTRVTAGSTAFTSYVDLANAEHTEGVEIDESTNPPLNIFK
ncbi:MAG: hypothetical protein PHH75_04615 [Candidatus Omnitrophica bacterium]|nr:hypothetical protein [Candidatus Omnitrophota bacterium]MDD5574443.1 hypothetical protein [Candidatus Omnitrophota bacterium]